MFRVELVGVYGSSITPLNFEFPVGFEIIYAQRVGPALIAYHYHSHKSLIPQFIVTSLGRPGPRWVLVFAFGDA